MATLCSVLWYVWRRDFQFSVCVGCWVAFHTHYDFRMFPQTYLGGAAAALALIVSSPFSSKDTPSFSLPSISLPAPSAGSKAPATAAPSVAKMVEKKVTKKLKNTSPYDFSLEEEVKAAEKEVKKDVAAERAAAAQVKKDELAAKKAAEKEAAAQAAEKKVR